MSRRLLAGLVVAASLAVAPAVAQAEITLWQTCSIGPGGDTALCSSGGFPQRIVSGPDGALYFTVADDEIGRITTTGELLLRRIPEPSEPPPAGSAGTRLPQGLTVGPDRNLWFTEQFANRIGRMTTAGDFAFQAGTRATDITVGPDRALWVTEAPGSTIARYELSGARRAFAVGTGNGFLRDLQIGHDDRLWFTGGSERAVGAMTTGGDVTWFRLPLGTTSPSGLTAGADGAMWFTATTRGAPRRGVLGRIARDGTVRYHDLGGFHPRAIHAGPDGALYIGSSSVGGGPHGILRLRPRTGLATLEPMLFRPSVASITTGPDGAIWFVDLAGAQIGRLPVGRGRDTSSPPPEPGSFKVPEIADPERLEVDGATASVTVDAGGPAEIDVRLAVAAPSARASGRPRLRISRRVRIARTPLAGRASASIAEGRGRVRVRLSASARRAIRGGAGVRVAVRARNADRRIAIAERTLRPRR